MTNKSSWPIEKFKIRPRLVRWKLTDYRCKIIRTWLGPPKNPTDPVEPTGNITGPEIYPTFQSGLCGVLYSIR